MSNTDNREWPEAADSEPIVPDMDPEAVLRKHDTAKARKLAAAMMNVSEDAVRDAAYVKYHDEALFQLVFSGEVHLESAKEILAGNMTVEAARKVAPVLHQLDRLLEKAETNPEILPRLEAFLDEFKKDTLERDANVPPNKPDSGPES